MLFENLRAHPRPGGPIKRAFREVGGAVGRWAASFVAGALLRRDLTALEAAGCLDATLADIGLARAQMGQLVREHRRSGRLLWAMLEKLGIEPEQVPLAAMREMAWTCTSCTDKRRCREWLAENEQTEFRAFCSNAAFLDYALLKQRQSLS